ncbi:hypothetical protein J2R97_003129 [Bradyrhizobium japonicum]|nr:hypothetical protein [Bradyrhizobium japonicum]
MCVGTDRLPGIPVSGNATGNCADGCDRRQHAADELQTAPEVLQPAGGSPFANSVRKGNRDRNCCRDSWLPILIVHGAHETKALAWKCLDKTLLLTGVTDRAPDGVQPRRQRRIGYDPAIPDCVDEIVLADDAIPAADQMFEQIENLGCRGHHIEPAPQFAPLGVQRTVLEEIAHGTILQVCPLTSEGAGAIIRGQ